MECLYLPDIDLDSKEIIIDGDEFHHLKVLRISENKLILSSNGKGAICELKILRIDKKQALAEIININKQEKPKNKLALALGILDNRDRFEFALEKCIELGISDFYPIKSQFTQKKSININRLELKTIAALKQSKQAWKTEIHPEIPLTKIFSTDFDNYLFADMDASAAIEYQNCNTMLIIGPEGGFSDIEIQFLRDNNKLNCISLGRNRLRAETAAISAISIINYLSNNF